MSLIRTDEFGTYVIAGGYVFRPQPDSTIVAGDHVKARHIGGTQYAKVGDEVWESHSDWDPRYIENWKKVSPQDFANHVEGCRKIANNEVDPTAPAFNNKDIQDYYRKRYEFLSKFL